MQLDGNFSVAPLRFRHPGQGDEFGRVAHACAVPPGLILIYSAYPALPCWAKLCRSSGAGVCYRPAKSTRSETRNPNPNWGDRFQSRNPLKSACIRGKEVEVLLQNLQLVALVC